MIHSHNLVSYFHRQTQAAKTKTLYSSYVELKYVNIIIRIDP